VVHWPPKQFVPAPQTVPHPPQLALSVAVTTHRPEQMRPPPGQAQVPPAQASPAPALPQLVPSDRGLHDEVETGGWQLWHPLTGLSVPEATNAPPIQHPDRQEPLAQICPEPQLLPFSAAFGVPVSLQTGEPEPQLSVPWSHGLAGVQFEPLAQATQAPFEQTSPLPQACPFWAGFELPVSTQTGEPLAQDRLPWSHGLAGAQALPAAQATHVPAEQTRAVPHEVPLDTGFPRSWQTGVPLPHEIWP
jgi:hypothetical protein